VPYGRSAIWRNALANIINSFASGDFLLRNTEQFVLPISIEDAAGFASNIKEYGATLAALTSDTWETSVCQWMGSYWDVLVDLCTTEEGVSDLVLSVRVFADAPGYRFQIQSVHVP
jgi:hypothetical protein